jgi:hypothetical protein
MHERHELIGKIRFFFLNEDVEIRNQCGQYPQSGRIISAGG